MARRQGPGDSLLQAADGRVRRRAGGQRPVDQLEQQHGHPPGRREGLLLRGPCHLRHPAQGPDGPRRHRGHLRSGGGLRPHYARDDHQPRGRPPWRHPHHQHGLPPLLLGPARRLQPQRAGRRGEQGIWLLRAASWPHDGVLQVGPGHETQVGGCGLRHRRTPHEHPHPLDAPQRVPEGRGQTQGQVRQELRGDLPARRVLPTDPHHPAQEPPHLRRVHRRAD